MKIIRRLVQCYQTARFKLMNLATIKDLPTDRFNNLAQILIESGWNKTFEYEGCDAWVDYGCIKLKKHKLFLILEWDNYTEGSIEGPRKLIEQIGKAINLHVIYQWRWE